MLGCFGQTAIRAFQTDLNVKCCQLESVSVRNARSHPSWVWVCGGGWRSRRNYPAILKCPAGDVMVMYGWLLWAETNWNITIIIQLQHSTGEEAGQLWCRHLHVILGPYFSHFSTHLLVKADESILLTTLIIWFFLQLVSLYSSVSCQRSVAACVSPIAPFSELCSIFVSVIITFNTP